MDEFIVALEKVLNYNPIGAGVFVGNHPDGRAVYMIASIRFSRNIAPLRVAYSVTEHNVILRGIKMVDLKLYNGDES